MKTTKNIWFLVRKVNALYSSKNLDEKVSRTQRVSGESRVVCHFHNLVKSSGIAELYLILPKYCKTFDLSK